MADFAPKINSIAETYAYRTLITEFENGSEQRRLKASGAVQGFEITSTPMSRADYSTLRSLYDGKKGTLTSFTFISPIDGLQYTVRFAGEMKASATPGTTETYALIQVQYALKVVKT